MPDPFNIISLMSGPEDQAKLQAEEIARRIRGNRALQMYGALGSHRAIESMGDVAGGEAKQMADLTAKAGIARMHFGAEARQREHEAALQKTRLAAEAALEKQRASDAAALTRVLERPQPKIEQDEKGEYVIIDPVKKTTHKTGIIGGLPKSVTGGAGKALTRAELDDIQRNDEIIGHTDELKRTFKKDYSVGGPLGGALIAAEQAARGWASKDRQERANWWSDFTRHLVLLQKHQLFGSALTRTETRAWNQAQKIKPGVSPEVIEQALDDLASAQKRILAAHIKARSSEGYNVEALQGLVGNLMKSSGRKIKVIQKATGKAGKIPEGEFDPNLYEKVIE